MIEKEGKKIARLSCDLRTNSTTSSPRNLPDSRNEQAFVPLKHEELTMRPLTVDIITT